LQIYKKLSYPVLDFIGYDTEIHYLKSSTAL